MAVQTYTVSYSLASTPGTIVDLSNVVSFSMKQGREKQLDDYSADTAQVTLRYPNGYASPITALKSGTFIRIYNYMHPIFKKLPYRHVSIHMKRN